MITEPLIAHATKVAQEFAATDGRSDWHNPYTQRTGGVEVDLAFGASRHTETATALPKLTERGPDWALASGAAEGVNDDGFWSGVERAWAREGGWRGDPDYRGRGVVVSAGRLKRAGAAGRTVGAVNASNVMEWEDNWPGLSAQAEMLLTSHQIFTFAGYSHHYGGFWRFEDDTTDRAVSYPYTEAGLQAVTPYAHK